jgi:hypothetical protein
MKRKSNISPLRDKLAQRISPQPFSNLRTTNGDISSDGFMLG